MSTDFEGSRADAEAIKLPPARDPEPSAADELGEGRLSDAACNERSPARPADVPAAQPVDCVVTLASLPPGARLVLRCRRDWRAASVSSVEPDCVRLNVASPTGHTYCLRRPPDSVLTCDGPIPILGDRESSGWRVALARYDTRW